MPSATGPFRHQACPYASDHEFATRLGGFLRQGVALGQAVAVATGTGHADLLRDELGADATAITFLDADAFYLRPARSVAGWRAVLREHAAAGHGYSRLVGEVSFGSPVQAATWVRYESALNHALATAPAWLACPYDVRTLPDTVLGDAARTHPLLCQDGRVEPSTSYVDPQTLLTLVDEPVPPAVGRPVLRVELDDDLATLRGRVRQVAQQRTDLSSDRIADLVLALSEVVANALRHGGPHPRLTLWAASDRVVCEVCDDGPATIDPLAGYLPPGSDVLGGMGLWLVRTVCDGVSITTGAVGTAVRFMIGSGKR